MRIFFILLIFFVNTLLSENLKDKSLIYLFKNSYYSYICLHRWEYINKYIGKREDLLSIVGYSCLKKHWIIPALDVAKSLRYTKIGRINAYYISSLFMIKKILIRYLEDKINISDIKIPTIEDDDLGKIFNIVQKTLPKVTNKNIKIKMDGNDVDIQYLPETNQIDIKFYKENKLLKEEKYW